MRARALLLIPIVMIATPLAACSDKHDHGRSTAPRKAPSSRSKAKRHDHAPARTRGARPHERRGHAGAPHKSHEGGSHGASRSDAHATGHDDKRSAPAPDASPHPAERPDAGKATADAGAEIFAP